MRREGSHEVACSRAKDVAQFRVKEVLVVAVMLLRNQIEDADDALWHDDNSPAVLDDTLSTHTNSLPVFVDFCCIFSACYL